MNSRGHRHSNPALGYKSGQILSPQHTIGLSHSVKRIDDPFLRQKWKDSAANHTEQILLNAQAELEAYASSKEPTPRLAEETNLSETQPTEPRKGWGGLRPRLRRKAEEEEEEEEQLATSSLGETQELNSSVAASCQNTAKRCHHSRHAPAKPSTKPRQVKKESLFDPNDEDDVRDIVRHGLYGASCSKPFVFRSSSAGTARPQPYESRNLHDNVPKRPEVYRRIALDGPLDGKFDGVCRVSVACPDLPRD
jgi:hypothetical protein